MLSSDLYVAERTMDRRVEDVLTDARNSRAKGHRFYTGVLNWLGERLVAWGWKLQNLSGATSQASTPQPVSRFAS